MKILGIDDDDEFNELLDNVFNAKGHDYVYVNNGQDGLKQIREKKFDVVLLDILMPDFSGKDVVNELAKNGDIKKQPIILLTASTITEQEVDAMKQQGVHACLRKPVGIDVLIATLDKLSLQGSY